MRKLDRIYTNPIDNLIIDYCDNTVIPIFYSMGFTANGITTCSLISSVIGLYYWYYGYCILSGLLLFISYTFDVLDGFYARKYKMTSKFGDSYDHIVDIFKWSTYGSIICAKLLVAGFYKLFLLFALSWLTTGLYTGCQERIYNSIKKKENQEVESPTLSILQHFCPSNNVATVKDIIKVARYFGEGTMFLYMSILIAFF